MNKFRKKFAVEDFSSAYGFRNQNRTSSQIPRIGIKFLTSKKRTSIERFALSYNFVFKNSL